MNGEKKKLREYLLGVLSEADMRELDLRIISDKDLEGDLQLAEHELMESYLEGTLDADEAEYFEKEFLACDERKKDLEFLLLLKKHAVEKSAVAIITVKPINRSLITVISEFFEGSRVQAVAAFAAVAIILLTLPLGWLLLEWYGRVSDPVVQMNQRDLSDPEQLKNKSTLDLREGNFRSGGNEPKLRGDNLSGEVLIRLTLPGNITAKSVFDVDLLQNDKKFLHVPDVKSYFNGQGQEMRLLFRREDLKKGDYQIELRNGPELPFTYSFSVE